MANKVVTDSVLQRATQDIMQTIADNIFEFESYSTEEIAELFNLTPEEAQHLSDLIADTVISQYKLWSSKKINDELGIAKSECNDYTDEKLSGIASISLKYCTVLPDTAENNCIYILKSTDSNPDTLNLYDGTQWTTIGSFTVSMDDYYTKTEVDTALDLKANKTEIFSQDNIIADTSLASGGNVLSASVTVEELNKKVDKTSVLSVISDSATDDDLYSAKLINNELNKKANTGDVVSKTDMSTTIDGNSTDDTVPTSKAVYDNLVVKVSELDGKVTNVEKKVNNITLSTTEPETKTTGSIWLV